MSLFGPPVLYTQISARRLALRHSGTGATFDEAAVLAVQAAAPGRRGARAQPARVLALGEAALALAAAARSGAEAGCQLVHPFAHPRILVSDLDLAAYLFRVAVNAVFKRRWLAPRLVMHPLDEFEGGLTPLEIEVLRDLARSAGAQQAQVWQGPLLTDGQLRRKQWPVTGRLLWP